MLMRLSMAILAVIVGACLMVMAIPTGSSATFILGAIVVLGAAYSMLYIKE